MSDKKNTPAVRFRGFYEEWEIDTLANIANVYDGTHQTPKYTNKGVMFLSVENITTLKSNKFISEEDFEKEFKNYPQKNDVLMTRIGDVGSANVVKSEDKLAYYVSLALIKSNNLNPYFLKESINTITVQKEIWHRTLHIAFPKKINKGEIEKIKLPYTNSKPEQTKIGSFFENLDALLTKHQTKHQKLQALKKAMLGKLFPKKGATTPEIRFKGFTQDWEVKTLGDIVSFGNGKAHEKHISNKGGFIVINSKFISTNGETKKFCDLVISPLKQNDIVMVMSDIPNGKALAKCFLIEEPNLYTLNQRICSLSEINDNNLFLYYQLNRNHYFLSFDNGVSQTNLKLQEILECPINIPSLKEQQQIGNYFKNLDALITKHATQIEKLGAIKKACLSKMFV
ncbi:restriction endonuclease subunit S [Tenacibaculum soleae]|uniref:restriction endonuclease subunit S n=1 Tax=Tenacibaculum soleae TaxID=447689 RepID=UPI00230166F6|nr:restriction endonuclease subunit S [Tenacibaculum soleae]